MSEGFEPPVRSHVHLFSRQAPSTTRTTHLWGCKDTILFSISNPSGDLLEPLGEAILGVEVVHGETDPAGGEHEDGSDDLSHEGDGFLDDVKNGEDREDDTDDVNEGSHRLGLLSVINVVRIQKYEKVGEIPRQISYLCLTETWTAHD